MRKELLGENEPELDNLGNPQPIHTAKDVKIMRSACRKVSLEEKPKSVILTRMWEGFKDRIFILTEESMKQ